MVAMANMTQTNKIIHTYLILGVPSTDNYQYILHIPVLL